MKQFRGTTILSVRRGDSVVIGGDGQVSMGDTVMKGMLAYDDEIKGKRPGVLIVHEWWGHNKHARDKARLLAKEGYVAFAVDMYGDRKNAEHPDDAGKFSSAVAGNMPLAKARFTAAMDTLKEQDNVESDKLAAMGYCFGGAAGPPDPSAGREGGTFKVALRPRPVGRRLIGARACWL